MDRGPRGGIEALLFQRGAGGGERREGPRGEEVVMVMVVCCRRRLAFAIGTAAVNGRVLAVVDVVDLVPGLDLGEDFLDQLDVPGTARVVGGFDQVHALVPGSSGLVFVFALLVCSCAFALVRACVYEICVYDMI